MRYPIFLTVTALILSPAGSWSGESAEDLARDRKLIRGTWSVAAYDQDGHRLPAEITRKMSVTIGAERITIKPRVVAQRVLTLKDDKKPEEVRFKAEEGQTDEMAYRLDLAKNRKVIELTQELGGQPRKITGLYALEEDLLTICIPLPDRKLPKRIPNSPTSGVVRLVLKREAAKPAEGK